MTLTLDIVNVFKGDVKGHEEVGDKEVLIKVEPQDETLDSDTEIIKLQGNRVGLIMATGIKIHMGQIDGF